MEIKLFFNCRAISFKDSFFSYIIVAWYSLDPAVIGTFKGKLKVNYWFLFNQFNNQFRSCLILKVQGSQLDYAWD